MPAKTLAELVTVTDEPCDTIGYRSLRTTPDARVTFSANCAYPPVPKHYVRLNAAWVEVCNRCGGDGNVGYGPQQGICYDCNGQGTHSEPYTREQLDAKLLRWARAAQAKSTRQAKKAAAAEAAHHAWRTEHAALIAWANGLTADDIYLNADDYTRLEATRQEAETHDPNVRGEGWRLAACHQTPEGRWRSVFVQDEPRFTEHGPKADQMIRRIRKGFTLDPRETAYLTTVMVKAPAKQAARAALAAASRHAAPVDTRTEITGMVTVVRDLDDDGYGSRRLVIVKGTGDHQGITWKTRSSAGTVWSLLKGDTVHVKATVKGHGDYKGIKEDEVTRPVFTRIEDDDQDAAPAPEETPAPAAQPAPTASPSAVLPAPQPTPRPRAKATHRQALGASCVDGWDLLYDKPRVAAQVVRNTQGAYGLACTQHKTVHPLARLTDERALRRDGGWCCH